MFNTYKINDEVKYWQTKSSAMRKAKELNFENDTELWVWGWEYDKGYFLEDLWSDYTGEIDLDEMIAAIRQS